MGTKKYIGITIGPIYKFMSMTSTPAGLWGTSYLFSYIAKHLCQGLLNKRIEPEQFITPALYDKNLQGKTLMNPKPGVGLYHDRIIIELTETHSVSMEEVQSVIDEVVKLVAKGLSAAVSGKLTEVLQYLEEALQIYALEVSLDEGINPLLEINKLLDAMELEQKFVQEEKINYVLQLMENSTKDDQHRNELIKKSFLVSDFIEDGKRYESWPLTKGNERKIRNLEEIAQCDHDKIDMKKYQYYAVIQADGDNMGKILRSFEKNDESTKSISDHIKDFSQCCFNYCIEAAEKANDYGAVTIYTGGDDFLALAPLENKEGGTVFDFIDSLSHTFNKYFKSYETFNPSLSFGVMMTYCKLPLYEAFDKAGALLFGQAKSSDKRNALAFHLQKHSGQSVNMKICHIDDSKNLYRKIMDLLNENWKERDKQNNFLKSAAYHIEEQKSLLTIALDHYKKTNDDSILNNAFKNIFDSAYQKEHQDYFDKIKILTKDLADHVDDYELYDRKVNSESEKMLFAVDTLLRLMKFYVEPGKEVDV